MPLTRLSNKFFSILLSIFVFSFCVQISYFLLPQLLTEKGFSDSALDGLELSTFFSQIIASLLLFPILTRNYSKNTLTLTPAISAICLLILTLINDHSQLNFFIIIFSSANFLFLALSFTKFLVSQNQKTHGIILFIIVWAAGYLCGDSIINLFYKISPSNAIYFLTILFLALAYYSGMQKDLLRDKKEADDKFSSIIKWIDIELLSAFTITYVLSSTYWWYEIIALVNNFAISDTITLRKLLVLSLVIGLIPISLIISKFRRNYILLFCYIAMFSIFSIIDLLASNLLINILIIFLSSTCMSCIFLCNILTLNSKFTEHYFKIAVLLYITSATLGVYCGPVVTDAAMDSFGNSGFTISVCFSLGLYITYYLYHFTKNKLYKPKI